MLLALNAFALYKRNDYEKETERLRQDMTTSERQRADMIVQTEQKKTQIAIELAKRQARLDNRLHLSVQTDSGRMYLERDGAILREMIVQIGPEQKAKNIGKAGQSTVPIAVPRGERTIAAFTDGSAPTIQLEGGTRIYSASPGDSAATATPVTAGDLRASATDLKAISANMSVGMKVYFF